MKGEDKKETFETRNFVDLDLDFRILRCGPPH